MIPHEQAGLKDPSSRGTSRTALRMMLRVLLRAITHRPAKLITIVAALAVGATLASAFLSLYFDLPAKMSSEFRRLGPNLLIAPRDAAQPQSGMNATAQALLDERIEARAQEAAPGAQTLPWLYAVAQVNHKTAVLAGTNVERLTQVHPSWQVQMFAPADGPTAGVIAGERAAALHGWSANDEPSSAQWVTIDYAGAEHQFPLRGIIATGGPTDDQLILPLAALQEMTRQASKVSAVEIAAPGDAAQVNQALQSLTAAMAENAGAAATVRALRPVIESQARIVMKIRGLMLGLTAIVLALVLLSVMITISGLVLDRSREIGVMKALGGSNARILQLLMAETSLLALAAAVAGYLAGFALARAAAQRIFASAGAESTLLSLRGDVLGAVVGITLAVALAACALPARQMRHVDPAVILRGE